ncbi:MAG: LTA synthase family protein [Nitrospira sp.]|nr:LTA synthase family protein [Nitrospira sp.]
MMARWAGTSTSIRKTVLFWWILFVVIQTAERLFLLGEALEQETPSALLLLKTLVVGVRGDFITATFALALALVGASGWTLLRHGWTTLHRSSQACVRTFLSAFRVNATLVGLLLFALLCVDMGYYGFNRQHMDFVFLEYIEDLFTPVTMTGSTNEQAMQQTSAELGAAGKWAWRLACFIALQVAGMAIWWWSFSTAVVPALDRWRPGSGFQANAFLAVVLVAGGAGFHHSGPYGIRIAPIGSMVYYTLAQNPVLFASEALRIALVSREGGARQANADAMPYDLAVRTTQRLLGQAETFVDSRYPLIRTITPSPDSVHLPTKPNILLLFLEGLDRRYLGQTYGDVKGTPFLDRLKDDSVYFQHFFSNGVQTSRGLFSTLCSTFPRHGAAAMKTRYAHDYLCLPSLLQRQGYHTEMVIGQHRDLNRLQTFVARNGLQQLLDEGDFPPGTERAGLGIVDGALFDLCYERIKQHQGDSQPFLLTTLTLSTHHPFITPDRHPEVRVLQQQVQDKYVAALRYTDLELERVFTRLVREGLLRNTIVVILGDHGRHEAVGHTDVERKAGHFASPLLIWMDDSLRSPATYRPRTVSAVASQVDVAPTVLALTGGLPAVGSFAGHDVSCLLVRDCVPDQVAYLTSVYDNLVGFASADGLLLYSLSTETYQEATLQFESMPDDQGNRRRLSAVRGPELLALHEVANVALDSNRLWSWRDFGSRL